MVFYDDLPADIKALHMPADWSPDETVRGVVYAYAEPNTKRVLFYIRDLYYCLLVTAELTLNKGVVWCSGGSTAFNSSTYVSDGLSGKSSPDYWFRTTLDKNFFCTNHTGENWDHKIVDAEGRSPCLTLLHRDGSTSRMCTDSVCVDCATGEDLP